MTSDRQNLKVLLVDDNPAVLYALRRYLELAGGMTVIGELHRADRLTHAAASLHPDVIVIDLTMPGSDPLDEVAALAAARPAIPIVVFSGHTDDDHRLAARRAGACAFVPKSASPDHILLTIREAAQSHLHPS